MDPLTLILAALLAFAGSVMYRWRGMNENDVPNLFKSRLLRRLLVVVLMAAAAWVAGAGVWALAVIPLAYYGIIVGHGSYFRRLCNDFNEDNENFSFLTRLIANPLNCTARFVGMALTGMTSTLPVALIPAIAFFTTGEVVTIAFWYVAVGILKAVIYNTRRFNKNGLTERIWGGVLVGSLALAGFSFGFWVWALALI